MIASIKKIVPFALMLILASGWLFNVNATETRVGSMGGVGFYTHDNSNIFFFPGAIYRYSGQVVGELRVKNDDNRYTIGVHYPLGDYSVAGLYLNRPINMSIPAGIVENVELNRTTDIFWGTQLASYDLGIKLSLGLDSFKDETGPDDETESARYIGIGGGLSSETMDLGVLFDLPNAKRELGAVKNTWGGFGFGLNARLFHGETTKLVPLGTFYYAATNTEVDPGTGTTAKVDYTRMNLGLGIGLNHQLDENNLIVGGLEVIGLSSLKADEQGIGENTTSTLTLPGLYMGLESKIKTWLTGRIGAAQVFQSTTDKVKPEGGTETKSTVRTSDFNLSFGLGFTFGDFVIDAAINEGLFFDGPNFISGMDNPMANRLSVTYGF